MLEHIEAVVLKRNIRSRDQRPKPWLNPLWIGLSVLAVTVLPGCTAPGSYVDPRAFGIRTERVLVETLPIALSSQEPTVERVGALTYKGGLYFKSRDKRFGGLSGLLVSDDGSRMVAVSDAGYWLTAELIHADGHLSAVRDVRMAPMLDVGGIPFAERAGDAEAIAAMARDVFAGPEPVAAEAVAYGWVPGGSVFVSLERSHRVLLYPFGRDGFKAEPEPVDMPAESERLTVSGGIKGLAALDGNTLLAVTEDTRDRKGDLTGWLAPVPVMVGRGGYGVVFLKAVQDFRPTDLAVLPDGDVVVLERSFSLERGAGMQLRRIRRVDMVPTAVLDGEVLARLDVRYSIDNMEALAVRKDPATGATWLYLLSDDNYNGLQRTVLLAFIL